jgi:arsenite transporter
MLMKIDFAALSRVREHWRGIGVTLFINWGVKPFSMALLGWLFRPYLPTEQIDSYIAGLIILAAAPCTASPRPRPTAMALGGRRGRPKAGAA